jgi:glucose-1-phosphate cytidylyltransferase
MVKVGTLPILVHIMNYYAKFDFKDFVVAGGYKSHVISEYFEESANVPISWSVKVVDTGLETATSGRIKLCMDYLENSFMMTYGDGLSNIDLNALLKHHHKNNKLATVTAVRPPARFGTIKIENGLVTKFSEKDPLGVGWINGGFFVIQKDIVHFLNDPDVSFESQPIQDLVSSNELAAYSHDGWWHPMDTLRDKRDLEKIWARGDAPWRNENANL